MNFARRFAAIDEFCATHSSKIIIQRQIETRGVRLDRSAESEIAESRPEVKEEPRGFITWKVEFGGEIHRRVNGGAVESDSGLDGESERGERIIGTVREVESRAGSEERGEGEGEIIRFSKLNGGTEGETKEIERDFGSESRVSLIFTEDDGSFHSNVMNNFELEMDPPSFVLYYVQIVCIYISHGA